MGDDERLSDIFKTIKKNKRVTLQKKNLQTPGHPIRSNSAFSPDQLELQIINGLLNLQSIPETANLHSSVIKSTAQPENQAPIQGYAEEAAPKNPLVLPASNPNNKRKCREKSISIASGKSPPPAGKKRGNEKSSRNIKGQLDINGQHETGGLQQFVQAVGKENVCANSIQDNSIERHCQQDEDLKKTASRAIIMEDTSKGEENKSQEIRKCLVLDEDKRELIAQNMVKICQNNSQVRNTFLELLNVLVEGGLLRFVALKVLSQGPCEEAQEVLNILDKSKTEPNSAHNLTALLHAVEKLHKAGDAFRSVSHLQDSKLFAIRYINQGSWEIQWHTACQTRS